MSKILSTGLRDFRNRLQEITNRFNEFRFGLTLISEKRKNYYFNVFLVSSTALTTGLCLSYSTVFKDQFKSVVHMYSSAELMPINKDLEHFSKNVWTECNQYLQKSSDLLQFFPSVGSEPITIGTLGLPSGALVGLPFNFTYKTKEDVKTIDLRFVGEHNPYVRWRSEEGQQLIESLVLSDKAKKFAIARHIHLANNLTLFIDCLNVSLSTIVGLGLAQVAIKRIKVFGKSLGPQVVFRGLSLILGFFVWMKLNQINNYYSGLRADKRTVSLGDDYLNGAIEYYNKLKIRNASFNKLMREEKIKMVFNEDGEVKGLLTAYLLTIGRRLDYLNALKESKHKDK